MNVKRCAKTVEKFGQGGPVPWSIRYRQCARLSAKDSAYCWQHKKKQKKRRRA
jgi:hypothetical protein